MRIARALGRVAAAACLLVAGTSALASEIESSLVVPVERWHNHAASVVETTSGDLLACWYHGSGERTADDVVIEGARLKRGEQRWGARFTMADTPGYPDTNCSLLVDSEGRLWLFWATILANRWETALLKYRIAATAGDDGPPGFGPSQVLHVTPQGFEAAIARAFRDHPPAERERKRAENLSKIATVALGQRLGWMPRAHPLMIDGRRLLLPLYSDRLGLSLVVSTEDGGATWQTSAPIVGLGNVQPSLARRDDGTLVALMRDNGPPPPRLLRSESRDGGRTWSIAESTEIANPGSAVDLLRLRNGHWLLAHNDGERGRHRLVVSLSEDEGRSWRWTRPLVDSPSGADAAHHRYPSLVESRDGAIHALYSTMLSEKDRRTSITHVRFDEDWIRAGEFPPHPRSARPLPNGER